MNSIDLSKKIYTLADLCTQEAKVNAHAVINDTRVEEINSTLQELFTNTYTYDENSPEQAQAAYILSHRIKDLHSSLAA